MAETNSLLNCRTGLLYRGFESPSLRQIEVQSQMKHRNLRCFFLFNRGGERGFCASETDKIGGTVMGAEKCRRIGSVLYFMLFCIVWFSLAFHTFYSLKTIKNVWEE